LENWFCPLSFAKNCSQTNKSVLKINTYSDYLVFVKYTLWKITLFLSWLKTARNPLCPLLWIMAAYSEYWSFTGRLFLLLLDQRTCLVIQTTDKFEVCNQTISYSNIHIKPVLLKKTMSCTSNIQSVFVKFNHPSQSLRVVCLSLAYFCIAVSNP
jgi:hypothetical protein